MIFPKLNVVKRFECAVTGSKQIGQLSKLRTKRYYNHSAKGRKMTFIQTERNEKNVIGLKMHIHRLGDKVSRLEARMEISNSYFKIRVNINDSVLLHILN